MSLNQNYLRVLEKFRNKSAGIFVDEANLFYIQRKVGWKIDWRKFKEFLAKYVKLKLLHYYMGTPSQERARLENERIKAELERDGFKVITKPLKKIYLNHQKLKYKHKCNFDVEISFDIARNIDDLDLIIIVSGDSDFLEAKNFCLEHNKGFIMMCFEERVAWEIRRIYHIFFEDIEKYIKKEKK